MKKLSLIILFGLSLTLPAIAQQQITLDLQRTITMANDSSLEAFRTKNMYLSGYWAYRTYKANRLPSLTLNMTPAQYNRDITKRYDSEQDLDIYRSQQSFYAYGNLAIKQNFDLTGGTFYLDTELGYMRSFGSNSYTQYTSVPIRVGYSQSLVGYNPFRWERKIEPLKYEKIKKEYIYNAEQVSEQATTYFFELAMAQAEYDLAKENVASSDTLYRIGMQRLKIASISRADLLTLKLDVVNARNTLQNAESSLKRAMFSLASFLNLEKNTEIRLVLPSRPGELTIPVDAALDAARTNNPNFLGLRQDVLEAEQSVDKTKKESRFNASIFYGCKLSCITVSQDAISRFHQFQAKFSDFSAYFHIFRPNLQGFIMQDFLHFCHCFVFFSAGLHSYGIHTLQCPGQVDCGGSGRIQIFLIFGKFVIKLFKIFGLDAVCQQINTQCRRYADGRSPSDFQQINGIPNFLCRM